MIAPKFLLEGLDRVGQVAALKSIAQSDPKPIASKRLYDEVKGPLAHCFDCKIERPLRSHDNDFRREPPRLDLPKEVDAVHIREIDVQSHNIGRTIFELREGFVPRLYGCRDDGLGGQIGDVCLRERRDVLDNQDSGKGRCHLGRTPGQRNVNRTILCAVAG